MKDSIRYAGAALVVAGTFVVSLALADDKGSSQKVDPCAMTGEKDKPTRQVYRIVSREKHVFEMHDPARGDNSETLEITYTRK